LLVMAMVAAVLMLGMLVVVGGSGEAEQ